MGLQNATARRLGVPDLTTTVLTLTFTGLAADSHFAGGTNPNIGRRLLAIAAMFIGASLGAVLIFRVGVSAALAVAVSCSCSMRSPAIGCRHQLPPGPRRNDSTQSVDADLSIYGSR